MDGWAVPEASDRDGPAQLRRKLLLHDFLCWQATRAYLDYWAANKPTPPDDSPYFRLAARYFLMRHRDDYATAYDSFRWPAPRLFNWALDYFDRIEDAETKHRRGKGHDGEDGLPRHGCINLLN